MLVKKVMTRKVITLEPEDTLETALKKFVKYRISGIPVINKQKKVIGMVTEEDVIKAIDAYSPRIHYDTESGFGVILAVLKYKEEFEAIRSEIVGSERIKVKDFMGRSPVCVTEETKIAEAARLMVKLKLKRLPVCRQGRLVGIIARADIVRALGKGLS